MTKLSTIPKHQLSITCDLCKHHTLLEVANLIAVVGGDTTAHEVRQKARCHNCGVKGNGHSGHVRYLSCPSGGTVRQNEVETGRVVS
jgi:hypothetical protein